ncbi:phage tail protein [Sphaerisporangium sp. NPDC004334]
MATLKSLLVKLGMDTKQFKSGVNQALGGMDSLVARAQKFNGVAKASGMVALAGGAVQLGAALAPAAGAMLAMPAAMAAVKVATLTAKVGVEGMSTALGALATGDAKTAKAALDALSPSARAFATEAGKFIGPLKSAQSAIQETLFAGLSKQLSGLLPVLPVVKGGMVGVAGALNGMAKEAIKTATTPMFSGALSKIFTGTTGALNTLKGAVGPLVTIVLKLATAGIPLMQRMAGWAVAGAKTAAAFLTSKEGADKLAGVVQRAGDTLAALGRIAGDIGTGLINIFKNAGQGSGDLLATIESLTSKFAAWSQSAQGQQQIATVFSLLGQAARSLGSVLPVLVGPLGAIASVLTSLPAPAQEVVAKVLAFTAVAGTLGAKLGPAVSGIRLLVDGIGKIGPAAQGLASAGAWLGKIGAAAVTGTAQAVAALGRFVASAAVAAGQFAAQAARMVASMALTAVRVVAGWVLMGAQSLLQAARVAAAWLIAMGPIGIIIAAVVALVALIVANWDTIKSAIAAAWEWIKEKTVAVWNSITEWFSNFWSALKAVFQAHVEWVRNLIARVWAAIQQTNATIWNAIKSFFTGLWNGIKSIFQGAVDAVKSVIDGAWNVIKTGTKLAWDTVTKFIGDAWTKIKTAVTTGISNAITLVKGLPGKILSALGNLGNLLLSAGKDLINGLINGVKAMASKVIDSVKKVIGDAIQGAKNLLGIASPSKVFHEIGGDVMLGFANGIKSGEGHLTATLDGVISATMKKAKKKIAQVLGGNETADLFGVNAADGEIARLLGGAKFGLDVKAIKPPPAPDPPKPPRRSDPNDVTYDRNPPKNPPGSVEPSSYAGGGQPPVVVHVHDPVIREDADIDRMGSQMGLQYSMRGAV